MQLPTNTRDRGQNTADRTYYIATGMGLPTDTRDQGQNTADRTLYRGPKAKRALQVPAGRIMPPAG